MAGETSPFGGQPVSPPVPTASRTEAIHQSARGLGRFIGLLVRAVLAAPIIGAAAKGAYVGALWGWTHAPW